MFKSLKKLISGPDSRRTSSLYSDARCNGTVSPGLLSWWTAEFTNAEREHILNEYQPLVMGIGGNLPTGVNKIFEPNGNPRIQLTALATWFISPKDDLPFAMRLLRKGVDRGEAAQGTVLDQHFTLLNMIRVYYRNRANDRISLKLAIDACERQIVPAPSAAERFKHEEQMKTLPAHTGFEQLAIIRERERDFGEAIRLSREAQGQGWSGDWEKRIARCRAKQVKHG